VEPNPLASAMAGASVPLCRWALVADFLASPSREGIAMSSWISSLGVELGLQGLRRDRGCVAPFLSWTLEKNFHPPKTRNGLWF